MSNLIIGLTGGIGSGKTTVTDMFAARHIDVIDADVIAREVVAPNSEALNTIKEHFGHQFIQEDGQLNRALLRHKIFTNEENKHWLNKLLHPLIRERIITQTSHAKSTYCLLVAPLLIENDLLSLVDRVLVVDVSKSTQLERTLRRDSTSSPQEIRAIIASQTTRDARLKAANDIIDNDAVELSKIEEMVTELHQKYLLISKTL